MATTTGTEGEHRANLAQSKHDAYVAKREGQAERYKHRLEILAHQAEQLTEEEQFDLRVKLDALRLKTAQVKQAAVATERKHREEATAAFKDLRASFRAVREKHGLVKPRADQS